MAEVDQLAQRFESERARLRSVSLRLLGSLSEADDAVQETWLRLARTDVGVIDNLPAWLTTVVTRVCLDMMRSGTSRLEESAGLQPPDQPLASRPDSDPAYRAVRAESVGSALLVVLDKLSPAERIAFVLHDLFAVPFAQIAAIVDRSPDAAKKLASRARARVRGTATVSQSELIRRRRVVEAFLAAMRAGDIEGLTRLLDPEVVRFADRTARHGAGDAEIRGASAVADGVRVFARRARFAEPALVQGTPGLVVVAPRGQLLLVVAFAIDDDKITQLDIIGDPTRLNKVDLAVLDSPVDSDQTAEEPR